jgi:hypothetical protein
VEAVVESRASGTGGPAELRFRPGSGAADRRGASWEIEGDPAVLALDEADGVLSSETYPDPLGRLWSALASPSAGDVMVSLDPGWETVDWGGMSHVGGGSHGSLETGDSLVPLLTVGLEPGVEATREQWKISDVAGIVLSHFGIGDGSVVRAPGERVAAEATG